MKIKLIFICAAVLYASQIYPDMKSGFNNLRNSYRDGRYIGIINSSSDIIDAVCSEIILNFYRVMPDIQNYAISNSNSSYNFSEGDGLTDYLISVEKIFTNSDETAVMTISSSPFDVERYDNLIGNYEYLNNKGDYERYYITFNKLNYFYIIDNYTAYFTFTIEKNKDSDEIISGLLFKLNFSKGVKNNVKKAIIENCMNNFIIKLKSGNLVNFLK